MLFQRITLQIVEMLALGQEIFEFRGVISDDLWTSPGGPGTCNWPSSAVPEVNAGYHRIAHPTYSLRRTSCSIARATWRRGIGVTAECVVRAMEGLDEKNPANPRAGAY
jgi:hypothetical protein